MTLNSEASQSARRRMTNRVGRVMQRHPVVKKWLKWLKWLKDYVAKKGKILVQYLFVERSCDKK